MKRVPGSEDFSLKDWCIDADIGAAIKPAIEEAIRNTFQESEFEPRAYLPYEWAGVGGDGLHGQTPEDPLTIYFHLPAFSENVDSGPAFQVTLVEMIDGAIELLDDQIEPGEGGYTTLSTISDRLKELAKRIDDKLGR
jgi:hypothetical protein